MSKRSTLEGCGQSHSKRIKISEERLNELKHTVRTEENLNKMKCVCETVPAKILIEQLDKQPAKPATSKSIGPSNAERYGFEYLANPLKPAIDKKIYKVVKLKNGVRAILISDISNVQTVIQCTDDAGADSESESEAGSAVSGSDDESGSDEDGDESDEEGTGSDEEEDGSDGESGSGKRRQSSVKRKGAHATDIATDIANDSGSHRRGSDASQSSGQEKLAAVGLTVGVGSFSDPEEIPGLAHFLEHMVFMGSEKYPAENHFDSFIKRQGGSDNAHTDCETTTFYFECQERFLREGMEKFSQFFTAPLMKIDAMSRERNAVESEFQESLSSDGVRWTQLVSGLATAGHPATKFTWGNEETLSRGTTPSKLHSALHEFRRRHYSGHRFTVAVQARLPIDQLEAFVAETFGEVSSNYLPPDDFSSFTNSFDTEAFHRLYRVESSKDTLKLYLTWALPPQQELYRSKPYDLVEDFLDEEGEGSLLAFLKQKLWAFALQAEHSSSGFETNSMYFLFSICIKLTDEGYRNIEQILEVVFGYLRMMRDAGPDERYFDERRRMAEARFNYCEESEATEYVEELSESLQYYPPEDCIAGQHLYYEYNPQLIKAFQDHLTPDNVNVTIFALDKTIDYNKREKWFNTKYTDQEIPAGWLSKWREATAPATCRLPPPNPFVPTDFALGCEPAPHDFPRAVAKSAHAEVWHKRDTKFLQPIAIYCFYLISPEIAKSAKDAVLLDLLADLLDFQLACELHPARAADISVSIRTATHGLSIFVSGFSQNLHAVLEMVFKKLASLDVDNEEVFAEFKLNRTKTYFNTFLSPGKLSSDTRLRVLVSPHWTALERVAALEGVDCAAVADFARRYRARLYVQCLAQGNISAEQALAAARLAEDNLRYEPLAEEDRPRFRVQQLELGKRVVRAKSFNPTDSISVMTNYYQAGLGTLRDLCMLEVLMAMMEEPLFDRLRTKEQLGYDVGCELRDTHAVLGFTVCVTYQEDKRAARAVDGRIDAFLARFAATLARASPAKLDEARRTVVKLKRCADVHLREEVNRNWAEVVSGDFLFDRFEREVAVLEAITPDEIRLWARDRLPGGEGVKELRQLSVQVVGRNDGGEGSAGSDGKGKAKRSLGKRSRVKSTSAESSGSGKEIDVNLDESAEVVGPDIEEARLTCKKHSLTLIVEDESFVGDLNAYTAQLGQYPYHKILE